MPGGAVGSLGVLWVEQIIQERGKALKALVLCGDLGR